MCSTDLTCVNATIQLVLRELLFWINLWVFEQKFWRTYFKFFICHCSFTTLAKKTTMRQQILRFLETFIRALSWIRTEVLFCTCSALNCYLFSHSLLAIQGFLQCVEFKNFCSFAVCIVLLFFDNLCPEYIWIPLELGLLRLFSVVCLRLHILNEKVSLSKKWKSSPLF